MNTLNLILIAALVLAAFSMVISLLCIRQLRAVKADQQVKDKQLTANMAHVQAMSEDNQVRLEENHVALSTVHEKVTPLIEKINQLEAKLREQEPNDPQIKLYQRATAMAQDGVTAEEIASACDLPLAEAHMLTRLYSNKEV